MSRRYVPRALAPNLSAATTHLWNTMRARCVARAQIRGGWRRECPRKDGTVDVDEGHYGVILGLADWEHLEGQQEVAVLTAEQLAAGPEA